MAHTYVCNFIHCVFSTKERRPLIPAARTAELYAYLGGIARGEGFSLIAAGGTANHVHLLFDLPAPCPLLMRFSSSKKALPSGWVMDFPGRKDTEPSASVPRRLKW
jgi:REP element-mobilizing transposase RayT